MVDEDNGRPGVGQDTGDTAEPRTDLDVLVLVEPFEPERLAETVDDTERAVALVGDEHVDGRVGERLAGRVVVQAFANRVVDDTTKRHFCQGGLGGGSGGGGGGGGGPGSRPAIRRAASVAKSGSCRRRVALR
jgi:hypothetical protein